MVVGHDAQLGPAVDHGEQREVVVGAGGRFGRGGAQGEGREDGGLEEGAVGPGLGGSEEDFVAGGIDAGFEAIEVAFQHELVELGDGLCVLGDLVTGFGVEDGEAGVDVPFLRVDAQHDVHLHVFEPADVAAELPGVLLVGVPCLAHGQEGGVSYSLRVGGDAVVLLGGEIDKLGLQTAQDGFDLVQGLIGGAVLDEHQGLAFGIDTGTVERVAGEDVDV